MKTYGFNKTLSNLYLFSGIGMFVLTIVLATQGLNMVSTGPMCIVFIVLGIWQGKTTLLKVEDDYFELKPAIARSTIRVLFSEISDVKFEKKRILYTLIKNGKPKKSQINLSAFDASARPEIVDIFQAAVDANQTKGEKEAVAC